MEASLGGKWLELLAEIAPGLKRSAIMFNPDVNTAVALPSFETAARSLKVAPIIAPVHNELFDKNGKIIGMVVGVGGFLGLGVKNIAVGMSAFDVIPADIGSDRSNARANDPTSVKLKVSWTKDQLMEAPDFQYFKPATRSATIPSPHTTGAAPFPTAPAAPK